MYICIYVCVILSPTAYYSSKINLKSGKFLMFFTRAQPGDQGGRQDFGFWRWPADGQGKNLGSPPKKIVIELNLTGKLLVKHCEIMTNVGLMESKKKRWSIYTEYLENHLQSKSELALGSPPCCQQARSHYQLSTNRFGSNWWVNIRQFRVPVVKRGKCPS